MFFSLCFILLVKFQLGSFKFIINTTLVFFFTVLTVCLLCHNYLNLFLFNISSVGYAPVLFNEGGASLNYVNIYIYWPFIFIFLFVTTLTLIYTSSYNFEDLLNFFLFVTFILLTGILIFFVNSFILFFLLYESFLIPSFLILYNYAKTRKAVEAAYLMFFWTQFGALFLIFNMQYLFFISSSTLFSELSSVSYSNLDSNFLFLTLLIGFGVKFPIWPFYEWLPKAHVEASTNFSIFLSGVLVKFAFFGFIKYLSIFDFDISIVWLYPFIFIGILDSGLKIYYQVDLKKLIAYSTVMEMHWLTLAVVSGHNLFWVAGFAIMISHALISSNFFLLIDSVTRRFKSRLVTEIFGLCYLTPQLYFTILTMLVVFLGFPGSLFFISEFLFFSSLIDLNTFVFLFVFFFAYFFLPSCFFKSWFLILFSFIDTNVFFRKKGGYSANSQTGGVFDLNSIELLLLWFVIFLTFWFGFSFQFFF